jgi:hypothetical protein
MTTKNDVITVTVSMPAPTGDTTLETLEALARQASLACLAKTIRMLQERVQRELGLERREWRERRIVTLLGEIVVKALKARDRTTGESFWMLNRLLGLRAYQRASHGVERTLLEHRVEGSSYRQAARNVSKQTGRPVSRMSGWRWAQRKGRDRIVQETGELETLGPPGETPEFLYLEADEIHVKAQRSRTPTHRVKVGLSYTGRERVEGYRKPRWSLTGKRLYGGVEPIGAFGLNWYASLERRHGVSEAPSLLYLADMDRMLWELRSVCFPHAKGQLDWAHLFRDFRSAAPNEAVALRWRDQVCEGRLDLVRRNIRRQYEHGKGNPDFLKKAYRALNHEWIEGWKEFRDACDPERTQKIPKATGGIEKNQEVLIGRAMKRRGMAWSERGANHLVKLIMAYQDKQTWNSLFKEPVPH